MWGLVADYHGSYMTTEIAKQGEMKGGERETM